MTIREFTNRLSDELPNYDVFRRRRYFNIEIFTKDGKYATGVRVTKRLLAHKLKDGIFKVVARTVTQAIEGKRSRDSKEENNAISSG